MVVRKRHDFPVPTLGLSSQSATGCGGAEVWPRDFGGVPSGRGATPETHSLSMHTADLCVLFGM